MTEILKTFYDINMIEVVPCLKTVDTIKPWMELFVIVLNIKIPEHLCTFVKTAE
jgi:hypothetical protein